MRTRSALLFPRCTAAALCCCAVAASAAAPQVQWFELRSPHFLVLTDSSDKDAHRIALQFERMRAVFHTLIPAATGDQGVPLVVLALKDKKSFQSIEPQAYLAKGQLNLAGLFLRTPDTNYILVRLDAEQEHAFATVYHEYTHLLDSKADWLPLWLDEGLAEFYQNTDIDSDAVRLGQPSADDILYLRQQRLLPLTTLLTVDHASPYYHEEQKGSVFYAEAWALTHYLIVTDRHQNTHRLTDYMKLLAQHQDPVSAATQAFGDLNQLQKALDNYVSQQSFSEFKLNGGTKVDEAAFQSVPVTLAQANALRASVLANDDRIGDASALLETVLHDDPNNALAHETMGLLRFRQHDIPGALKWYSEAVQLDSQSFLAHYYFAVFTLQSGQPGHDDAIESSLRAAIKLNPSFAPAYDALASFYGQRHEKFDQAHLLSNQAIQLDPKDMAYRLNYSNILMEEKQPASALSVLQNALRVAQTPEDKAILQGRIEQMQQYQASMEKYQAAIAARGHDEPSDVAIPSGSVTATSNVVTSVSDANGVHVIATHNDEPHYPDAPANGPHRTVQGTIGSVKCSYPKVLTLTLNPAPGARATAPGKPLTLYTNDFYSLEFYTLNFQPQGDLQPCTQIQGMKASVVYTAVTDDTVAGQLLRVELSK